jgi:pyruvate dehydrogenase E2 component (dihydrolipoamide acetyltransferase)
MPHPDTPPPLAGEVLPEPRDEIRPMTGIRKVVARRMAEAWRTIPAVTLNRTLPMGPLLELRTAHASATGTKLSLDAVLAGCVARALASHPILNSSWLEAEQAVAVHGHRNIAVAVDTPGGLTIVVLRDADAKAPAALTAALTEMVGRARNRRSLPADVADATFTITNLGALGIETFSPIITLPQAAVLGVGRIAGPEVVGRPAHVSLTFDHRVADGADAARFLVALGERIEEAAG